VTPALLFLQAAPPAAESYLADFLRTLLALTGVLALGWFGLRQLARRGFGRPSQGAGAVHVIARIPLEARKSLYVVRAGKRVLLLGTGEAGPPSLIAELDPGTVRSSESESEPESESGSGSAKT
jgi:flagellar biogenesis protein FliO